MDNIYSEVKFVRLDNMHVASFRVVSQNPEEDSMSFLNGWAQKNGYLHIPGIRNFGFDVHISKQQQEEGLRGYEYWLTVPDNAVESDGIKIMDIKEDEYAVIRITDPFSDPFKKIPNGWQNLHNWVENSEYKPVDTEGRHWLEEIVEQDGITYMYLYYPIDNCDKK